MSCCQLQLWGGKCCSGPGQPTTPPPPQSLPPNIDLSALGIFNPIFYGASTLNAAAANQQSFQAALDAADANNGGQLWIPTGTYQVLAVPNPPQPIGGLGITDGTTVIGMGCTTTLVASPSGNVFYNSEPMVNNKGITFREIRVAFEPGYLGYAGDFAGGAQNIRWENCYFNSLGLWFDNQTLSSGCSNCTLDYEPPTSSPSVYDTQWFFFISGPINYMKNCTIRQAPIANPFNPSANGPVNCVGLYFQTSHETHVTDVSLQNMDFGMQIDSGVTELYCQGVSIQAQTTALSYNMHSNVASGASYTHKFTTCRFSQTQSATSTAPCVRTNIYGGASNTVLDDLQFENVSIYQCNGNGLQLDAGNSVDFQGKIGSCGFNAGIGWPAGTYYGNVALTSQQGPNYVNIHDSDLSGVHEMSAFHGNGNAVNVSPYAIVFNLGPSNGTTFLCSDTDLSGCQIGAVVVASGGYPPQFATITRCHGYNDTGYVLASGATGAPTAPTSAASLGWFGPTVINLTAPTGGNLTYALGTIQYTILAGESAEIYIPSPNTNFSIVGTPAVEPSAFHWKSVWQ